MLKKISSCLAVCLLALTGTAGAQGYTVKTALDSVPADGYYSILVDTILSAYTKLNLADIRIAGPDGKFVPYIVRKNIPAVDTLPITKLQLVSSVNEKNATTVTAMYGSDHFMYTMGLDLTLNNTLVARTAQLSGSADNERWFIIDDNVVLQPGGGHGKGTYTQHLNFPSVLPRYFKLKINNAHTDPVHVVAMAAYHEKEFQPPPNPIMVNPKAVFTQKDSSDHFTYITARNSNAYPTTLIDVKFSSLDLYERNATLYALPADNDSAALDEPLGTFQVSLRRSYYVDTVARKMLSFVIKIENRDNPPLKVTSITTAHLKYFIICRLEKGKHYTLLAGDEQATAPQYDLAKFADSIPIQLPGLAYGPLSVTPHKATAPKPAPHSYWIWVIIVISVMVLSLLTYKLMLDIKKDGQRQ